MALTHALSINNYGNQKFIVSTSAANGTHTTLAGALADATSGDTIVLRDSVTENVTIPAGIHLMGMSNDGAGVSITGKITMTAAGTSSISNIQLITNSDFFLVVSGSANSVILLTHCYLNCLNNTGISYTSSGSSSSVTIQYCNGNIATTGISLFASSGANNFVINYSDIENSGLATTASTISAGLVSITCSRIVFPITTSGTADIQTQDSTLTLGTNTTVVTHGGSGGNSYIHRSELKSGSASAVSIGGTLTMSLNTVNSTNVSAVTGAGTLINAGNSFINTSYGINTSTQTAKNFDVGGVSFDGGSNLLSIFQQGTFSPVVVGSGTAGTPTMTVQVGRYQKVGRLVSVSICAQWTTLNSATGSPQVNNMPFTCINSANIASIPAILSSGPTLPLVTAAGGVPILQANNNAATANVNYYLGSTGAGTAGVITASNGFLGILTYETI